MTRLKNSIAKISPYTISVDDSSNSSNPTPSIIGQETPVTVQLLHPHSPTTLVPLSKVHFAPFSPISAYDPSYPICVVPIKTELMEPTNNQTQPIETASIQTTTHCQSAKKQAVLKYLKETQDRLKKESNKF